MACELESLGHAVIVADPNYAQMYANRSRRSKTDNGAELLRPDGEALGVAARTAVSTRLRAPRARASSRATSARSCGRPTARLLHSRSSRPTTGTLIPSIATATRYGHASSNDTLSIDDRTSTRPGGTPSCRIRSSFSESDRLN